MKIRVLVVDDDEDLLFLATKFLGKQDDRFELVSANTDQEALQKIEEEEFDAIVCDHYLGPHSMTGLDLLEWVREANPHIPFIIFTGRSQEAVAIRALNLGADYYLKKGTDEFKELFIDIAHRIRTEVEERRTGEALERAYEDLEHRVNERTAKLQQMNDQLKKEVEERQRIETALIMQRELGNTLCKTTSFSEALDHILKTAVQLDGFDCGGIYLADSSTGKFDLSSSKGISAHFLSKFSEDNGPSSIREPLYLSSSQINDSADIDEEYKDIKSVAIIPVQYEDTTAAVLSLGSYSHEEVQSRDRHTLEAIATQIAAYISRVKAEQKILENRLEMKHVLDAIHEIIIVVDTDFQIISANSFAIDKLGLNPDDIDKMTIDDIYDIREKNKILDELKSKNIFEFEGKISRHNMHLIANTRITTGKQDGYDVLYFLSRLDSAQ